MPCAETYKATIQKFKPDLLAQAVSQGKWQTAPHLRLISDYLEQVAAGRLNRLQVNVPPRHGKTHLVGHYFPFYYLSLFPDRRILYCIHSAEAARWAGIAARDIVEQFGSLTGIKIRPGYSKATDWQLVDHRGRPTGGGMKCVSVGTRLHGAGGNLIILDDLFGTIQEATSAVHCEKVWRWAGATMQTRLMKVEAIVSIGTPFSYLDHFSRFAEAEETGGEKWTRLRLPALAGPGDPLGRAEGAALWPAMFSRDRLLRIRDNLIASGNYRDWAAQYDPLEPVFGDGVSDWPKDYFDGILADEIMPGTSPIRVLSLDPSKGRGCKPGDYSAWIDATLVNKQVFAWSDLRRVPLEHLEDVTVSMMQANAYQGVIIEGNGFQEMIAVNIVRKAQARGIYTPVYSHVNTMDKVVRIRSGVGGLLQHKMLKLLPSPGRSLLLAQLKAFPNGHDDGPDALELAQQILLRMVRRESPGGGLTLVKV